MSTSRVVGILLCISAVSSQTSSPCVSPWTQLDSDTCVNFVDTFRMTASLANTWCQQSNAFLLRFADYNDVTNFARLAGQRKVDGWWSDLQDTDNPGHWTWGGTQQVTPGALGWATEPTDTHHVENCVTVDNGGSLNDDDCLSRHGYVCTYLPLNNASCGGGYQLVNGQCYYLSSLDDPGELVHWDTARNACLQLSPQSGVKPVLASFTTTDQLAGLQTMVQSRAGRGKRWVGLNDRHTERQWAWSDGTSVADMSFINSHWKTFPDRGTGDSCGLVHSDGHMEEAYCGETHYFACMKIVNLESQRLQTMLGCPPPWIRGGDKCYLFNAEHWLPRNNTQIFCAGAHATLLKIETVDELDWVTQQTVYKHMYNVWTGLKRSSKGSTTWVWDDGTPADPLLYPWDHQPYQPVMDRADCAYINTHGVYSAANCYTAMSFICELTSEDAPCPQRWLSDDSDPDTPRCYYVSLNVTDGAATWQEALGKCRQLSGLPEAHLVAINSKDELDYMISLMSMQPYAGYWTDLTDKAERGLWAFSQTYEGTIPPIPWDKEPNNFNGHEDCAMMVHDGRYKDVDCGVSGQVVCQKPAILHTPQSTNHPGITPPKSGSPPATTQSVNNPRTTLHAATPLSPTGAGSKSSPILKVWWTILGTTIWFLIIL